MSDPFDISNEMMRFMLERIAKIYYNRQKWAALTDSSGAKEVSDELFEQSMLQYLRGDRPSLYRIQAIEEWRLLTREIIGWAFTANIDFEIAVSKFLKEKPHPDYDPSLTTPRSELSSELSSAARRFEDTPYCVVVLPTELARSAGESLLKLDYGEVDPIFEPAPRKSYVDGYTIPNHREYLTQCCHYLYGTGLSMRSAYDRIAAATKETAASVRNWDRSFNNEGTVDAICVEARLRGAYEAGLPIESAFERLSLDPSDVWALGCWDNMGRRPRWNIDEDRLRQLGQEYRRDLEDQKARASKR